MPDDNYLNYKSSLFIYEDQDGALLYPRDKDEDNKSNFIVSLYDHKIALLLTKKEMKITIYCHIIAAKKRGREIGLYLVYGDTSFETIFGSFKKCAEKLLKEIEFNFSDIDDSFDDIFGNNIIFENIAVFNLRKSEQFYSHNEMDLLKQELSKGERLTYSGGNESTIPNFVIGFLENIPECSICVSSTQSETCNLNIRTDFRNSDLSPIGNTKIIIERIREQIRKIEEEKQKVKDEKLKEDKLYRLENVVKQLHQRGCNNSSILHHLYSSNSLSICTPIDRFVQTLVKSECNEKRKYSKDNLTSELLRLFKDPYFRNMLYESIINTDLIECLYKIKESRDSQGSTTNKSKESTRPPVSTELNELDNIIKLLLPRQLGNSDIIRYIYQHPTLSSPTDCFIKTVVDTDIAINQKKDTTNDKFKLSNKFVDLFKYLNSEKMLDWKLIEEDEHIKALVKNTNKEDPQPEFESQLLNSGEFPSKERKKSYDHNLRLQGKKIQSYPGKLRLNFEKLRTQTGNKFKKINNRDSGKNKKRKEKKGEKHNALTKNRSKRVSNHVEVRNNDKRIKGFIRYTAKILVVILILLTVIILIYFYLLKGTFSIGNFTLGVT